MKSVYVRLNGMKQVNEFVHLLQKHTGEFDLKGGKYTVDAKSILGIFSLDTSDLLELVIYDEDETIMEDLKSYLA
ncbi:HPr family phosphocarrier protein [Murimonas intestini]|uniref:HPr family phosphocarrier protein n=1 Tax=Murimonas intestini TaxID=1337051 RepID=UPI0011DDC775|nr:HPr family phosphocarrier protein [Murimonas intestini]